MPIEVDLKEIMDLLSELSKKLDMLLAEESFKEFLEKEPDIYTVKDVKARVNCT